MVNNTPAIKKINLGFGYLILGLIIILGSILYLYYDQIYKKNVRDQYIFIDDKPVSLDSEYEQTVSISNIVTTRFNLQGEGSGNGLELRWEMKIPDISNNDNWKSSYDKLKPIILIGESPQIFYNPKEGNLVIKLKYRDNPYYSHYPSIKVNLPLQRWNKIGIILDNRKLDVYLNNKLVRSVNIPNVPIISNSSNDIIKIGEKNNNIRGEIKNLTLFY